MKVGALLLGLVGAAMGWLEPASDEMADLARRSPEVVAAPEDDEIVGSRARGYHSEGARFYVWQPERAEVVAWVEELSPFDRQGPVAGS